MSIAKLREIIGAASANTRYRRTTDAGRRIVLWLTAREGETLDVARNVLAEHVRAFTAKRSLLTITDHLALADSLLDLIASRGAEP